MPTVSRRLDATPAAAWAALSDIARWPSWLPTVTAVSHVSGTPARGVAASYAVEQPGLRPAVWTVTSWVDGSGFVWQSRQPGVRTTGTHTVAPASDGGTTVDLGITWAGPLAAVVRAAYGRRTTDYITREADALAARAASRA